MENEAYLVFHKLCMRTPEVPDHSFLSVANAAPLLQELISECARHLERIYRFLYTEIPDRILQGEDGEKQLRSKYQAFFHELDASMVILRSRLPYSLLPLIALEDDLMAQAVREKSSLAWNYELQHDLGLYIYWFEGILFWFKLVAHDLNRRPVSEGNNLGFS